MNLRPIYFAFPLLAFAALACGKTLPSPADNGAGGAVASAGGADASAGGADVATGGAGAGGGTGGSVTGHLGGLLVDDFEDGDANTEFGGGWYVYLDDVSGGLSTVTPPE